MLRRSLNVLLMAGGGVPLVWALRSLSGEPRRAAALALLALIGIALNLTGLTRKTLNVRGWLRGLACAVAAVAAGASLLLWHRVTYDALPAIAKDDIVLRAKVASAGTSLVCIAVALIYVGVSMALLPPRRPAGREPVA